MSAALAEHEAKLAQQKEALPRQHQKGLATLQARINALQATVASDSAQHTTAYAELQRQLDSVHRDKEAACSKGEHAQSTTCCTGQAASSGCDKPLRLYDYFTTGAAACAEL